MGLFSTRHAPMQEPELSDVMRKRLDELHERQDKFERIVKELRLEWDEMYDKFRLLYARVAKRIKDSGENGPKTPQDERSGGTPYPDDPPRAISYDRPYLGPTNPRNY